MRFRLTLNVEKHIFGNRFPFNYQYELSGVIYKILSLASEEYATWLHDNGKTDYLSPSDERSKESILFSLLNRYKAFYGVPYSGTVDFDFDLLNTPKSTLVTFKANTPYESKVKGYLCKFRMKADPDLMKLAYECGIGMKGSQGWGMVKTTLKY